MKKDKLYFLTFISISVIFLIIASFAVKDFIKVSVNQIIEVQLESSKREADEIANSIQYELSEGIEKANVIKNIQKSIKGTNSQNWFICVFDWSGKEIAHPDITKIGQKVNSNQSLLESLKEENSSNDLYDLLTKRKKSNGSDIESEIVYIASVKESDLLVAAHANISKISSQTQKLKKSFYTIFIIMGFVIILLSFFAVRIIGSFYEKQLEQKNTNLESELINLSKLNTDLIAYQDKIIETVPSESSQEPEPLENNKKRILTYIRNELIPIETNEISYIFTENTITFVITTDGKKSTSNMSLDDIYTNLDPSLFFRANRQFIISIKAIEKIIKYGNSQLKILVQSDSSVEIIISKNKAAEFKQWLNI